MKVGGSDHNVPFKEGMTVQDALDSVQGNPSGEFRIILNGAIVSVDTVIPKETTELVFVGSWQNGIKKKV
jgi:sulfur carrier protein ThiS